MSKVMVGLITVMFIIGAIFYFSRSAIRQSLNRLRPASFISASPKLSSPIALPEKLPSATISPDTAIEPLPTSINSVLPETGL